MGETEKTVSGKGYGDLLRHELCRRVKRFRGSFENFDRIVRLKVYFMVVVFLVNVIDMFVRFTF